MHAQRTLFWLLVGALLGFGVIAILSIGILFLALGLALAVFGLIRLRDRGLWAAIAGFGAVPTFILVADLQSPDSLSGTSVGNYQQLALIFGVVTLVGLLLGAALEGYAALRHHSPA